MKKILIVVVCLAMIVISAGLVSASACSTNSDSSTTTQLQQGQILSVEASGLNHQISVLDVSDDEKECGVSVDDDVVWVAINQITKVNGVVVKVLAADIISSATQDTDLCEISFYCENSSNTVIEQVNGNTLKTISSVWSEKKEYKVGERIVIYAKVLDSDGTPSTPEEGTTVGFGLDYDTINTKILLMVRYNPSSGYYEAETTVPAITTAIVKVTASRGAVTVNNDDYSIKTVDSATTTETASTVPSPVEIPAEPKPVEYSRTEDTSTETAITKNKLENPTVSCMNGCAADSKCLPFGTRIVIEGQPNYCDISQSFGLQKAEGAKCQNNYECASNQCSNSACVDLQKQLQETQSMLKRVMKWLSKIFGSEE